MGRASQEVISSPSQNGHNASGVSRCETQPFPPSLHIANSHRIVDVPALVLSLRLPIAGKKSQDGQAGEVAQQEISDSQGSFDSLLYRSMLEAKSRVSLLKGFLLLEGQVFELPYSYNPLQSRLQAADQSGVFPLLADAIARSDILKREYLKREEELMAEGNDGATRGKIFGVRQEIPPAEIKSHSEIGDVALNTLGVNMSIFAKRDKDGRDHILNSVYRRAMRAVETPEEKARINLAMEVACDFFGLVQKNVISIY